MTDLADLVIEVDVDADHVAIRMSKAADDVDKQFDKMAKNAERSGGRLSKIFRNVFDDAAEEAAQPRDEFGRFLPKGTEAGGGFLAGLRSKLLDINAGPFLKRFGSILTSAAKPVAIAAGAGFAAPYIASIVAGLASGAKKVAHGVGAIAALLPAAAVTGVLAMSSLKIAVLGVGDAISAGLTGDTEAYLEALDKLSPSARSVVREFVGLRDEIDALKTTVQERFFDQFEGQVARLGGAWLPMLRRQLGLSAQTFGVAVDQAAGFLGTPAVIKGVEFALRNGNVAIANMAFGLTDLLAAFLPLITVGSTFLPQLTRGWAGATERLAAFMVRAEQTGRLREFIQGGIDSLGQLVDRGQQLWRIFTDITGIGNKIFAAAGIGGMGLLDTIERLVDRANRFLETPKGAKGLQTVFSTLRMVVGGFLDNVRRVGKVLADAIGPHVPAILDFLEAFLGLKAAVLDVGLDALAPILGLIGNILGTIVLPALTGLANWLATNQPVLQGIGIAIMTVLVPAFIAWAINAGIAAINTLLLLAPILLIGAAIAAFAALVIIHWDTIVGAFKAAFNWVKENWPLLLAILTGPIGLAVLFITKHWGTIKDGARAVKDWIVARFNDVVSFFTGLPGRLARAAGSLWDFVSSSFKSAINSVIGMWNDFQLGPWTIGGWETPGPIPDIPAFTIGPVHTPNLPMLADGGVIRATPGGSVFRGGEGGRDEAVIPLPRGIRDLAGMGGGVTINQTIHGSIRSDRELIELIRDEFRRGGFGGAR